MLRWLEGAKPGKAPKRPSRTPEEAVASKKRYEEKRTREFKSSWQAGRPWLHYTEETKLMFCEYCRRTQKDNQFAKGTANFRVDPIQAHVLSKHHKEATAVCERAPATKSSAAKALHQLRQHDYDQLVLKFRNAHAVAKEHQSFKAYKWLCKLDKAKGYDVGDTYLTDKKAKEFVYHIATAARTHTSQVFDQARFFGATCDGSSDFMGDEYESLFIRTSIRGKIKETFLKLGTARSASGADIYDFIKGELEEQNLSMDKMVGFCADGASNMQGRRSGVASSLLKDNSEMVIIHCLAHRLELAFKDAVKAASSVLYDKAITMLLGLYYFYRQGPKQKKGLKRAYASLEMTVMLPTRVGGTRWLPHISRALEALVKGYRAFRYHLENESHSNPKAEGLVKLLRDKSVMTFVLTLKEIIAPLMKLSLNLQKQNTTLADGMLKVNATKDVLHQMKNRENAAVQTVLTSNLYQGETLHQRRAVSLPRTALVENLEASLEDRFPANDIIEASVITGFNSWPSKSNQEAVAEYGNAAVTTVLNKMKVTLEKAGVALDEVEMEWTYLKSAVYQRFGCPGEVAGLQWEQILGVVDHEEIKGITAVVDLLLSLPATSVRNETCFSRSKLTKNKRRGHLQTSTLNDLLTVEMETPDISTFNPEEAIKSWMVTPSGRRRRLGYVRVRQEVHADPVPSTSMSDAAELTSDAGGEAEMLASGEGEVMAAAGGEEAEVMAQAGHIAGEPRSDSEDEEEEQDDGSDGDDSAYESEDEMDEEVVTKNLLLYKSSL